MRCVVAVVLLGCSFAASVAASDPFEVTTPGVPDSDGLVPELTGSGASSPNSANSLALVNAPLHAPALLVFSMSELAAPFAGGIIGPAPDFFAPVGVTDTQGTLDYRFRMPPEVPVGLELWMQMWVTDVGAVAGVAASNTLHTSVKPSVPTSLLFPGHRSLLSTDTTAILLADLNSDGLLDAATLHGQYENGKLATLLGRPDGSFDEPIEIDAPGRGSTWPLASADLDGDGDLDLVATFRTNFFQSALGVYLGAGDGNFALAIEEQTADQLGAIALDDFNADGFPDLVVARGFDPAVLELRLGQGDGSFGPGHPVADFTAMAAGQLLTADMNADGNPDLVAVSFSPNRASVFLGAGDGTLTAVGSVPCGQAPLRGALADLDNDGLLDLTVTNAVHNGSLTTLRGVGGGALGPPITTDLSGTPIDLWLGDLNEDGLADSVVALNGATQVFLGVGDGSFTPTVPHLIGGSNAAMALAVGDLGSDGMIDIVGAWFIGGLVTYRGSGPGTFHSARRFGVGPDPRDLAVDDLDGDGHHDLIVVRPDTLTVRHGVGDGSFGPQTPMALTEFSTRLRTGDVNADGAPDVVLWGPAEMLPTVGARVSVLLNQGNGDLQPAQVF